MQASLAFQRINTIDELQQALQQAHGHYIVVDVYADWCTSCTLMKYTVFNQAEVISALHHIVLLQMDVTANNADDKALEKYLHVYAPPTIIFFDQNGNEVQRLVGDIDKKTLIDLISKNTLNTKK
jgi:thiol:disulfide interchange protein DsbD